MFSGEKLKKINKMIYDNEVMSPVKIFVKSHEVKLEEMITIGIMKRSRNSGAMKKMLHVPTMRLFAVKEEPITNHKIGKLLQEKTTKWKKLLSHRPQFIKLYNSF